MKKHFFIFIIFLFSLILYAEEVKKNIPDVFFGMHTNKFLKSKDKPWPTIPFKTWRIWDTGICWPTIEPEKGKFNFDLIDKAVKYAKEKNVEIVINIGLCPRWAAARPNDKSGYGPELTASEPKDINDWKEYVRILGERYKGEIKYWEIWNEPDMLMFYTGSIDKMVELVKTAHDILKKIDNENMIISPPVTGYLTFIPWLDEFLRKGGKDYIDIIGTHFYIWSKTDTAEKSILTIRRIQSYAKKNGIPDIPIWDTECGYRMKIVTETELQNGNIARLAVVQWYYGIERVMYYSMDNKYIIRMMDNDYKKENDIGRSFREVQRWLIGAKVKSLQKSKGNIWIAKLEKINKSKAVMIWHSNDLKPKFKIDFIMPDKWKYNKIIDLLGKVKNISKGDKLLIGVSPILLYEDNFLEQ